MKANFGVIVSVVCLGLAAASTANAALGFHLESTAFPKYEQNNNFVNDMGGNFDADQPLKEESGFSYDLRNTFGIKPLPWVMLGVTYNYGKRNLERDASTAAPSLDKTWTNNELGPSLGIMLGNLRVIGTYFLSGAKKRTEKAVDLEGNVQSDMEIENKLDSGYQVTLGYSFALSPFVKIGPALVYRNLTYKSQTNTNRMPEADPAENYTDKPFVTKATDTSILPMISLIVNF